MRQREREKAEMVVKLDSACSVSFLKISDMPHTHDAVWIVCFILSF